MELTDKQQDEVTSLLTRHPTGLSLDGIYQRCEEFGDKTELARALHVMGQQGVIFKKGMLYFNTMTTERVEEPEPPRVVPDARGASITHAPSPHFAPPAAKSAPVGPRPAGQMGDLNRSVAMGAVAMTMWAYRHEEYSLTATQIKDRSECTSAYTVLPILVDKGYINKYGEGRGALYKWSGVFSYPFPRKDHADTRFLKKPIKPQILAELGVNEPTHIEVVKIPSAPFTTEATDAAVPVFLKSPGVPVHEVEEYRTHAPMSITLIDTQIALHEGYLSSLRELRKQVAQDLKL